MSDEIGPLTYGKKEEQVFLDAIFLSRATTALKRQEELTRKSR